MTFQPQKTCSSCSAPSSVRAPPAHPEAPGHHRSIGPHGQGVVLAGRDLIGIAQTGTGKTAAFALPSLDYFARNPKPTPIKGCRMLVLAPTRELAAQIAQSFRDYGRFLRLSVETVFGGVPIGKQIRALAGGVDCPTKQSVVGKLVRIEKESAQQAAQLRSIRMRHPTAQPRPGTMNVPSRVKAALPSMTSRLSSPRQSAIKRAPTTARCSDKKFWYISEV